MRRDSLYILILGFLLFSFSVKSQDTRTYDGYGNNQINPEWGMAGGDISRISPANYADGVSVLDEADKPGAREISNVIFSQTEIIPDKISLSDYVWVFGQFIDHDISLVENGTESLSIEIPEDDEFFNPAIPMILGRSEIVPGTGITTPREFENKITAFLDGSAIYGSSQDRADYLRSHVDGKLKVSNGNLLPWNTTTGEFNDPKDPNAPFMADDTHQNIKLFVAGDIRANENPLLIALHTIFVREHNRQCEELSLEHPNWGDEILFQSARKRVIAILQSITYNEWLPAMGMELPDYQGYNADVNPNITNAFSAAAFRVGHTLINSNIIRMDNQGEEIPDGNISLRDAYFNPLAVRLTGGIDSYLKGMATQVQQNMDCKVIDDVRNFLFGAPGQGGLDLVAINIKRGRDRGLANYNQLRSAIGMPAFKSFFDLTNDHQTANALADIYGSIDELDAWVGLLGEDHMPGSIFGELIMDIIEKQFRSIRDGDRYWYEIDNGLTTEDIEEINNTRIYDLIVRNTGITLMQKNLFEAMPHTVIPNGPALTEVQLESVLYPNPVGDEPSSLKVYSDIDTEASVRIMDNQGRTIKTIETNLQAGENFIEISLGNEINRGLYNLLIESGNNFRIVKMIKQ
jgi:hypothetical protein